VGDFLVFAPSVKENHRMGGSGERTVYALRPPGATKLLRVLGVIDLVGGVAVTLVGLALIGDSQTALGVVLTLLGLVAIWAGVMMSFGGVAVTTSKITSLASLRRSCRSEDIDRIDIVRSDFRHLERVLPIVVRKDGSSMKLVPLAWPYRGRFPGSNKVDLSLDAQAKLVSEIRSKLSVQGHDFQPTA
jgi:hypothetical protein